MLRTFLFQRPTVYCYGSASTSGNQVESDVGHVLALENDSREKETVITWLFLP
jgi:hypothetical protein